MVWREFGDEVALVAPWASTVHTITKVGARVWLLADGRSLAQILEQLELEFEVDRQTLATDIESFLVELDERKLLEQADG